MVNVKKMQAVSGRNHSQPAVSNDLPVSNPDNPYDQFGYHHNLVVSYLMACKHPRMKQHDTPATHCLQDYAEANDPVGWQIPVMIKAEQILADSANGYRNVIAGVPFRGIVKQHMLELLQLIKTQLATPKMSVLEALIAIKGFEAAILADSSLLPDEKKRLLEGSAVARYSMDYWNRLLTGTDFKSQAKLFGWFAAVTSDVSAALVTGHFGVAAEVSEVFYWLEIYVG